MAADAPAIAALALFVGSAVLGLVLMAQAGWRAWRARSRRHAAFSFRGQMAPCSWPTADEVDAARLDAMRRQGAL